MIVTAIAATMARVICVSTGCVGHTSVHSDSGSRAWGSGACARCVEQQQQPREVHVRQVTLLLRGETPPRRARVRAAAAAAAASSGPIGTIGLL